MLVWPLDYIESYLVSAPAIQRILVEELGAANVLSVEGMRILISEVMAKMQNAAIDHVSAKIGDITYRLERKRFEPTQTNPMARKAVEEAIAKDHSVTFCQWLPNWSRNRSSQAEQS